MHDLEAIRGYYLGVFTSLSNNCDPPHCDTPCKGHTSLGTIRYTIEWSRLIYVHSGRSGSYSGLIYINVCDYGLHALWCDSPMSGSGIAQTTYNDPVEYQKFTSQIQAFLDGIDIRIVRYLTSGDGRILSNSR